MIYKKQTWTLFDPIWDGECIVHARQCDGPQNQVNQYSAHLSNLDLYIPDYYYQCFHATNNHTPILKSTMLQVLFIELVLLSDLWMGSY